MIHVNHLTNTSESLPDNTIVISPKRNPMLYIISNVTGFNRFRYVRCLIIIVEFIRRTQNLCTIFNKNKLKTVNLFSSSCEISSELNAKAILVSQGVEVFFSTLNQK